MGTLRRITPLSDHWGRDRGTPVDRYYIEQFLKKHSSDIHGRVLEVKDNDYTFRYGTAVTTSDVLDIDPTNSQATIIADLAAAETIASNLFDCFILTQTIQFIYDIRSALLHTHRILKPGGVLLATVPAISRIDKHLQKTDYWRLTVPSSHLLFGDVFGHDNIDIVSYGNVLTGITFLTGMACEELAQSELDMCDAYYPLIITVRAIKH